MPPCTPQYLRHSDKAMLSVFSPLVPSQMLSESCADGERLMTIFQSSYDSTSSTVISQVKEAINNLYDPSDENITTPGKRNRPSDGDPGLTAYEQWHSNAMDKYSAWQKSGKKSVKNQEKKKKSVLDDPNENMAAFLVRPESVAYYRSNEQHTPTTVVHERWEQEVKEKGVFTTRGDGGRLQCVLPSYGVSKGTWPFCLLPCLHCFFSPVPYVCIPFVGH
jgi:hypothetical protein